MRNQEEKNWDRKANRILRSEGLRLASSGEGEPGWYYRVTVDGETVQVWVTDEGVK